MRKSMKELMKEKRITMRDLSDATGVSSALVCYIAQGYARFPEAWQLHSACLRLGCEPTDIYTPTELHRFYPKSYPSVKKPSQKNPRISIDKEMFDIIKQNHGDVATYVKKIMMREIRHELMQEEGHYI